MCAARCRCVVRHSCATTTATAPCPAPNGPDAKEKQHDDDTTRRAARRMRPMRSSSSVRWWLVLFAAVWSVACFSPPMVCAWRARFATYATSQYIDTNQTVTVGLTLTPVTGPLTLAIALSTGSGSASPWSLTWAIFSTDTLSFDFVAPSTAGSGTFTFTFSGSDVSRYTNPDDVVMTWMPRETFTFGAVQSPLYTDETSDAITVTPSAAAIADTTLTIIAPTSAGLNLSATVLTWSSGSSSSQSFTVSGPVAGQFSLQFVVGSSSLYQWDTPAALQVNVSARADFTFSTIPSSMKLNAWVSIGVTPSAAPASTVTLTISLSGDAGSVSPSTITFTDASTQYFSIVSSWYAMTQTLSFAVSESDAAHYLVPAAVEIAVAPKYDISAVIDSTLATATATLYAAQTIAFNLSVSTAPSSSLAVTMTGVLVPSGSTLFSTTGSLDSLSARIVSTKAAPATWTTGQTALTISFSIAGDDVAYYVAPASVTLAIANRTAVDITHATTLVAASSSTLTFALRSAPPTATGVTIAISVQNAVSFSPSTLLFTSSSWSAQSMSVSVGSSALIVSATISGEDAPAYLTPASLTITVTSQILLNTSLSQVYAWPSQPAASLSLVPFSAISSTAGGITVTLTTSPARSVAITSTTFAPSATAAQTVYYRPPNTTGTDTLIFTSSGTDAALFPSPSSITVNVISYPDNAWGPSATACACSSAGTCSTGWWGDGTCTCASGFTGATCSSCLAGYYGASCTACACVYGTCADGITGTGACTCQSYWSGTTCSTPTNNRLLPQAVSVSCIENTQAAITFAATVNSPAWATIVTTLPANGTLYTTADGTTLGSAITSVPYTIASSQSQLAIYVPPTDSGLQPGAGNFATFTYRVSSTAQNNVNNYATVSIVVNILNAAPVINLASSITPNLTSGVHATSGQLTVLENTPTLLGVASVSDPDAVSTAYLLLTLAAESGALAFSFPSTLNPSWLAYISPTPADVAVTADTYSSSTIAVTAPIAALAQIVACVLYVPPSEFVGSDTVTVALDDEGASGVNSDNEVDTIGFTTGAVITVGVVRVNKPIVMHFSAAFDQLATMVENEMIALAINITDADAGSSTTPQFRISALYGYFTYASSDALAPATTSGTLVTLNAVSRTLVYHPPLYYSGPEVLTFFATDGDTTASANGPTNASATFSFDIAYVDFAPVANGSIVDIPEDKSVVVTLAGVSLDDDTTAALVFSVAELPDASCMQLFQWDASSRRRGVAIAASDLVTSSSHQLLARMVYGSRALVAADGCPFSFTASKPSGVTSLPATVAFNVTFFHNHAPNMTAQTVSVLRGIDAVVTLIAHDADGDNITFWLRTLPTAPLSQLFYAVAVSDGTYTRGASITRVGLSVPGGVLIFYTSAAVNTSSSIADSFLVSSEDVWGAFDARSSATISIALEEPTQLSCANLTIYTTMNAPAASARVDLQSALLATTGLGFATARIEVGLASDTGTLYSAIDADSDGVLSVGSEVVAGTTITADSSSSRLLSLFYEPPTDAFGSPLGQVEYSCISFQGVASATRGILSFVVYRLDRAPELVTTSLTIASVPYPAGIADFSFDGNATDADIIAGTTVAPETTYLTTRILSLPAYGTLKQHTGATITSVPTLLTDGAANRLTYVPDSSVAAPFYDSFFWSAYDGLLASSVSTAHFIVGAASMPPSLSVHENYSTYEGGVSMRILLTINISEPMHLGTAVSVYAGVMPSLGYLTLTSGDTVSSGSLLQSSTAGSIALYYVPPTVKPLASDADNFTLYATNSLHERSAEPDLVVSIVVARNQPPVSGACAVIGTEGEPALLIFNASTYGTDADLYVTLSTFPDPATQGTLYACAPEADAWSTNATQQVSAMTTSARLTSGCNGDASAVGVVFVPIAHYYTLTVDGEYYQDPLALQFTVHDGAQLASDVATGTIDLLHVIYPPVAIPQNVSTVRDVARIITLNGTDWDNDHLTAQVNTMPSYGQLYQVESDGSAGVAITEAQSVTDDQNRVLYVPDTYYFGSDSFTFQVAQLSLPGAQTSDPVNVGITVEFVALAPFFAVNTSSTVIANVSQNTVRILDLSSLRRVVDPDGLALTFTVRTRPSQGSLYQVLPTFNATLTPADTWTEDDAAAFIGDSIFTADVNVTHPQSLLAFEPGLDDLGDSTDGYYYTSFTYTVCDTRLTASGTVTVEIDLLPVYQLPRPLSSNTTLTTLENTALLIILGGTVDTHYADADYNIVVSQLPLLGTVCQMTKPTADTAAPCGDDYGGAIVYAGARLSDTTAHRLVYMPPVYGHGAQLDYFGYRVLDSLGNMGAVGIVEMDVTFVNQPPYTPSGAVLGYTLDEDGQEEAPMLLNLTKTATDPDDDMSALTFRVTAEPTRGLLYSVNESTLVGTPLDLSVLGLPYTLPSPYLLFHPNGEGGAANPYALISLDVTDTANHTLATTITITLDCGHLLYPNVWTVGTSKGALCLSCPTGALCSSLGLYKPVSKYGWWRSSVVDASGGPIYLECPVESSCLSAAWDATSDGTVAAVNASSTTVGSLTACATGYQGIMCAACATDYFVKSDSCVACPAGVGTASTLKLLAKLMALAVPLVAVGLALLWFVKRRLKVDLSFVTILLNFSQTVSTFKAFSLAWPSSNSSTFSALSVLNIDMDVLSLECSIPSLTFTTKWLAFMLLPVIAAVLLAVGALVGPCFVIAWKRWRARRTARRHKYALESQSAADVESPFSPSSTSHAASSSLVLTESPPLAGPLVPLYRYWLSRLSTGGSGLFIMFCGFIYLPLCIKCMDMLACTELADGTLSLDYQPALRCDEHWWHVWSKVGVACLVFYSIGIPVLYMYIFFHLRPQVGTYTPACLPPGRLKNFFLCPRTLNRPAWREDVLIDKRARLAPHPERTLESYIALQRWRDTFSTLVQPFRMDRFYWSVVIVWRNFIVSLCAVFLQNTPLYQCAVVLTVLGLALALQMRFRAYKLHIRYDLNALECASLIGQAVILTCGMIFYIGALEDDDTTLTGSSTTSYKYPGFRTLLTLCTYVLMVVVVVSAVRIFYRQVQFRMQYHAGWRRSKTKQRVRILTQRVDRIVHALLRRPSTASTTVTKDTSVIELAAVSASVASPEPGADGATAPADSPAPLNMKRQLSIPTNGSPGPSPRSAAQVDADAEVEGLAHSHADSNASLQVRPGASSRANASPSSQPGADAKDTALQDDLRNESTPSPASAPAPPPRRAGHSRLKSSIWRPPRLSIGSPLRALDARSLYTHARYASLNDLSLRQIGEINSGAPVTESAAWDDDEQQTSEDWSQPLVATHGTPTAVDAAPSPHQQASGSNTDSHLSRSAAISVSSHMPPRPTAKEVDTPSDPLAGVDFGRARYGRWFKPPPPAGLFLRRAVHTVRRLVALKNMFAPQTPATELAIKPLASFATAAHTVDEDDDFAAHSSRVKKNRHMRRLSLLTGLSRLRAAVQRLLKGRRLAKRLGLAPHQVDPETGVPLVDAIAMTVIGDLPDVDADGDLHQVAASSLPRTSISQTGTSRSLARITVPRVIAHGGQSLDSLVRAVVQPPRSVPFGSTASRSGGGSFLGHANNAAHSQQGQMSTRPSHRTSFAAAANTIIGARRLAAPPTTGGRSRRSSVATGSGSARQASASPGGHTDRRPSVSPGGRGVDRRPSLSPAPPSGRRMSISPRPAGARTPNSAHRLSPAPSPTLLPSEPASPLEMSRGLLSRTADSTPAGSSSSPRAGLVRGGESARNATPSSARSSLPSVRGRLLTRAPPPRHALLRPKPLIAGARTGETQTASPSPNTTASPTLEPLTAAHISLRTASDGTTL